MIFTRYDGGFPWLMCCRRTTTGWWFQRFLIFTPILGEMIQFGRAYFSDGLVQPPTRGRWFHPPPVAPSISMKHWDLLRSKVSALFSSIGTSSVWVRACGGWVEVGWFLDGGICVPSQKTNSQFAPEKWWLVDDPVLWWPKAYFQRLLLVPGRVMGI